MINLKWLIVHIYFIVIFITFLKPNVGYAGRKYSKEDILKLREEVREMFNHAYNGYLKHAYPYDELRPLSCDGVDTWGSYSLTLIDALDTLAVMGNYSEFRRVVDIVTSKADFDANINVSVFETNIRIVGGLLSAHLLSQRAGVDLEPGWPCNGPLLRLAEDVAKRLIAAFDTETGMPYGTVNLRHGVPQGETSVTCTAGVGTFILEFGALSRLTGDPVYEEVALNALHALYHHRSSIGLYGNHIDVQTGRWTAQDSGIGAGVDSYLEYLVKGSMLVQRPELMAIFNEGRAAIDKHLRRNDWYLWVSMHKGQVTLPVFQSLEAYWPGVLSLIGDISEGMKSMHNYHQVWKQYGFTPEFYNIAQGQVGTNRESYPLRPELIESTMYLYRATQDPFLLDIGMDILRSIQHSAKTKCGYATIKDCRDHSLENRMESFFLAETTKYLYLLFDPDNFIHNDGQHGRVHTLPSGRQCILDSGGYIFNTEAHPIDPGALLCCSESVSEPKHFNKKNARGEKLSNLIKRESEKSSSDIPENLTPFSESTTTEEIERLPSAITEEEVFIQNKGEFLELLKDSGALDVVKIPLPSTDEIQSISRVNAKFMSLNMLQMIETLINVNPEKHLIQTTWRRDLLVELIEVIENAANVIGKKEKSNVEEIPKDSGSVFSDHENTDSVALANTLSKNSRDSPSITNNGPPLENVEGNDLLEENQFSTPSKSVKSSSPQINKPTVKLNSTFYSITNSTAKTNSQEVIENQPNDSENTFGKNKKDMNVIETVLQLQFKTFKNSVLLEADFLSLHLNKCYENLEVTKTLMDLTDDNGIRTQFLTKREDAIKLALELNKSLKETQNFLNSEITEVNSTLELFKKLVEIVVDGNTVNDFIGKYQSYMQITRELIDIGKEKFLPIESNTNNNIQEENVIITDIDLNESEEINSSYNDDDSKNIFEENSWKADDSSYQVDDRERVSPVSKMDAGPLFTDKLRLKTESVIGLLPTSLVPSESPFNPQTLLERIRDNPRYYRNTSWAAQYSLLTCMPQPYLNRIMLSGEFYND